MSRPDVVPHNRLTHGAEEADAVRRVVASGQWAQGPRVAELEAALARTAGVREAAAVGSGLAGLRLALKAFGVGPDDAVMIPAYSCVALANAVLALGARVVPVDVSPGGWNMSAVESARAAAAARPKAAIVVHTFGRPVRLAPFLDLGIPIVEDCAHAFGLTVDGVPLGGGGHASVLSFYATKLLGAGEGGAVLTSLEAVAAAVRESRDYTDKPPDGSRLNDKMTDLTAALAVCQLGRLDAMLDARRRLAERYHDLLAGGSRDEAVYRLPERGGPRIWYRYAVEMSLWPARTVIDRLARHGIAAAEPVRDWRSPGTPACPIADRAYERVVSLPLYPTLTGAEQERVARAFLDVCREMAGG